MTGPFLNKAVNDLVGRNADVLPLCVKAISVIVVRVILEQMICDRTAGALFDLDAHADFSAFDALIIFLVEIVGLDELQSEAERVVAWVFNLLNQNLAVTRQRLDEQALRLHPRKTTVSRAEPRTAPCCESALDKAISYSVEAVVIVPLANLHLDASVAHDVRRHDLQIALGIGMVPADLPASVAQDAERWPDLAVCRPAGRNEICEEATSVCPVIAPATDLLCGFAFKQIEHSHIRTSP